MEPKESKPKKQQQIKTVKEQKERVNLNDYNVYCSLKFTALSGAKLKDEATEKLNQLESKIKKCSGKIPSDKIFTKCEAVNAAINSDLIKLVRGIPVPEQVYEMINSAKKAEYYFK